MKTVVEFNANATWACPAGITKVKATLVLVTPPSVGAAGAANWALRANGAAYGSGANNGYQLGDGTNVPKSTPTLILGGKTWRQIISSYGGAAYGIDNTGVAWSWGAGQDGKLGNGAVTNVSTPTLISGSFKWKSLATPATSNGAGVTVNGDAYCWGQGSSGEIGDGTVLSKSTPTLVLGGLKWQMLACGAAATVGLAANGDAYCWGSNSNGQLGANLSSGTVAAVSSPTLVVGGYKWKFVAANNGSFLGITTDGRLYVWGSTNGMSTSPTGSRSSPVPVTGGFKWNWVSSSSGGGTLGILNDGTMMAWGTNGSGNGVLGVGDLLARSSPVQVSSTNRWVQVSAGSNSVYAIDIAGNLYAWGTNTNGQLGTGDVTPRSTPTLVSSGAFKWQALLSLTGVTCLFSNELAVVPGSSYAVNLQNTDGVQTFGPYMLWTDTTGSGDNLPTKLVFEYGD
jgi:alpha-tubulin suppressor-like RCC1 family protein